MKFHSMVLETPIDHRKHSIWVFDRYWNITKTSQLNLIIKRLTNWTKYDSRGRVLCVGFPTKDMALQDRVFIVKMGHDKKIWSTITPLGKQLQHELSIVKAP